ncbi:MAG: hypothetical protein NTV34_14145 [Proteobacteria bacterium]|nr:hypothetical protein [Pseudomonadota bacterium]
MKAYVIAAMAGLIAQTGYSASFTCRAEKSVVIFHNDQMVSRRASTVPFEVAETEHQDSVVLEFVEENGSRWGNVEVSGESHMFDDMSSIVATAIVTDANHEIQAFLNLTMPRTNTTAKARTLVFGVQPNPTLTLECSTRP